jgi:NADP-reducing hydrogenase subunit HndB
MTKLMNIDDFKKLQEESRRSIRMRTKTGTRIIVGMGTCGIAAGARQTLQAIVAELQQREIDAHVTTVGCIGMCASEPLVDIEQADGGRITYGQVKPDMIPRLIEEHLIHGRPVEDLRLSRMR